MAKQGLTLVDSESGHSYRLETPSDVLDKNYKVILPEENNATLATATDVTNVSKMVHVGSDEPTEKFEDMRWFDIGNDIIKIYKAGSWKQLNKNIGDYIKTPSVSTPVNNETSFNTKIQISELVSTNGYVATDFHLQYQIAKDANFTDMVMDSIVFKTNTFKPETIVSTDNNYYIRVRYISNLYYSHWSTTVKFSFASNYFDLGVDNLQTVISGNSVNGAYFGEITSDSLVSTRDYRGPYVETTVYKANTQASHNGKLWNARVEVSGVEPGTDDLKWEEDNRDNLPTGEWLLNICGVGVGGKDDNRDGYSSGSTTIGTLKNNDQGFLKFAKDNKVIYVAKKPFVDTIGWNDLAKRNLVYGDRTVKIGSRLYYVRLITEAEYQDCLVASTNGTLASLAATDLALEEKTWLHDTQESAVRKAYSGTNTVENISPKSRVGSYRPVLELIEEGDEPYNNLPACPAATDEDFQYDEYTDTGYFGEVPSTSILSGTELANSIGLATGTAQHDTAGYLKFYWHGKVLFIAKRTLRHTVSWDNIKAANAVFGVDLGGSGKVSVSASGFNYNVALMTGARTAPADDVEYWENYYDDNSPSSTDDFLANVALEVGKYSQWNELMYRVHQTIVDDVLENQDGDANYKELTGGVQIGDNWANFTNAELSVFYAEAGNGTVTWTQEISSYGTTHRVCRGYNRLANVSRTSSSNAYANYGWRPALVLN